MTEAIAWREIRKEYGSLVALRGVDLAVAAGESVVLLGPNGAGKSTLLRIGAALTRPSAGRVSIGGEAATASLRGRLGYLGHATLLYDQLTARENLEFYGRLYRTEDRGERAERLLAEAGVDRRGHEPISRLSRGTQQRVALCRAFLHRPDVLLFDEPFTGLDPQGIRLLGDWTRAHVRAGGAALITTHDLAAGLAVADRIAVIVRGRIAAGRGAEGLSLQGLADFYAEAVSGDPRR